MYKRSLTPPIYNYYWYFGDAIADSEEDNTEYEYSEESNTEHEYSQVGNTEYEYSQVGNTDDNDSEVGSTGKKDVSSDVTKRENKIEGDSKRQHLLVVDSKTECTVSVDSDVFESSNNSRTGEMQNVCGKLLESSSSSRSDQHDFISIGSLTHEQSTPDCERQSTCKRRSQPNVTSSQPPAKRQSRRADAVSE